MIKKLRYYQFLFLNFIFITTYSQWNNVSSISGNSTVTFNASKVLSDNNIFLIGDDGPDLLTRKGVIYKSVNNGVSFTKTNTLSNAFQLSALNFVDNNNGFVFGQTQRYDGFVGRTTNGGLTWTNDSINGTEQLKANSFINAQTGYVSNFSRSNLMLFKTIDGGANWNLVCNTNYQNGPVNEIQFLTENLGFLCTQTHINSSRYAKVMRTVDGGNTWTTLRFTFDEDYTSVHFFDYYNGYVLTYYGKIYKTTNAGVTWTLVKNSNTLNNRNELKFIHPNVGYVVGADSILKTTDGGNTWINIHGISTLSLFGYNTVDVNSNGIGIAAGGLGSFYSYTNNFGGAAANNTFTSAYISGYDSICNGQNTTIRFDFTGAAPWSVSYSNGTNTQTASNITTTPYFATVTGSAVRQVFTINTYTANGVPSSNIYGKAVVAMLNAQTVSATITGTKAICIADSALLTIRLKGNKPYTFTYTDGITNNIVANYNDSVYTVYVKPLQTTTYTVVSVFDKCNHSGTTNGSAVITVNIPPAAPTNFSADTFIYNKIRLSWTDNANNEDSIIVERRYDSIPEFTRLRGLAANSTSFIDSTAKVNYKYYYRLKYVTNNSLCYTYSNPIFYFIYPLFKVLSTVHANKLGRHYDDYNCWYDWNNDGNLDNINSSVMIYAGNDSFTTIVDTMLDKVLEMHKDIVDLNKDNIPDVTSLKEIKVNGFYFYPLQIYKGNGNNSFTNITQSTQVIDTLDGNATYRFSAVLDIDGDGDDDIISPVTQYNTSSSSINTFVAVFENKSNFNFSIRPLVYLQNSVQNILITRNIDTALSVFYMLYPSTLVEMRKAYKDCNDPTNIFPVGTSVGADIFNSASWNIVNFQDLNNDGGMDMINSSNPSIKLLKNGRVDSVIRTVSLPDINYSGLGMDDIDNDGFMDLIVSGYYGDMFCLLNNKDGSFKTFDVGFNNMKGKKIAIADYNKDGRIDFSTSDKIYKNTIVNNNKWININCIGTKSSTIAYGTKVKIKATINGVSMWQTRLILPYAPLGAQNSPVIHFGLGNATKIDSIKIFWPSGIVWDSTTILPNQNISITEPYITRPIVVERPTNFSGTINNNSGYFLSISEIALKWCTALNAQTYTIQRKKSGETNFINVAVITNVSYTDTSLMPNTKYVYRIMANGYSQTTYSDTITVKTDPVSIRFPNGTNTNSPNTLIQYIPSRSRTMLFDIYSSINSAAYTKIATIHACSDSFIYNPAYLDVNTPRNSTICYYFVAYYPTDTSIKSYSATKCVVIGDYCSSAVRNYGLYAVENNFATYTPMPVLCPVPIELYTYNSNNNITYTCNWYWNDSIPLNVRGTKDTLTNASRKGSYRVIFNANTICPDTSNRLFVNFDGDGYNKITFELLNRLRGIPLVCNADTVYLKVHSRYPFYDSSAFSSPYVKKVFVRDSNIYKLFLISTFTQSTSNILTIYDKYISYCNIQTADTTIPLFNPLMDILFTNNRDSVLVYDDLIVKTHIYDPLWQYRKHTSLPWTNIPVSYYNNDTWLDIVNYINYNRSGYYRVIDTICNDTSREALGLRQGSGYELLEAQLFDSANVLMKNIPYTFTLYSNNNYSTVLKTFTGTTDNYGRLILDSILYSQRYYWKISFTQNGKTKAFSDTILYNSTYTYYNYVASSAAIYRVKFIFRLGNFPVGVKQNTLLESLAVYPNPSNGNINVRFNTKLPGNVSISLFNNLGQMVKCLEPGKLIHNGLFEENYFLEDIPKGFYLLEINLNDERTMQKIIIE